MEGQGRDQPPRRRQLLLRGLHQRGGGRGRGHATDFASGDFKSAYDEGSAQAIAAFGAPGAIEKTVTVPFGQFPGAAWMALASTDTLTHAWDLAKATGQSTDIAPELAEQLLAGARMAISDEIRGDEPMPFAKEQPCPDGASAADRLAAFLGRTV